MKYDELIEKIKAFATSHPDVERFGSDTMDRFDNISNNFETYPLLYVSPKGLTPYINENGYKYNVISLSILCVVARIELENPQDENNTVFSQTVQNIKQTQEILNSLLTWLNDKFDTITAGIQLLNEYGIDRLQGSMLNVDIEVDFDTCGIDE